MMARTRPLVAGNWKMNGVTADLDEIEKIREAVEAGGGGDAEILICPPATLIRAAGADRQPGPPWRSAARIATARTMAPIPAISRR